MVDVPALRLVAIDRQNWRDAVAVRVSAEQLPFVAGHQPVALVVLAKAYVRPGGLEWEPLAVMRDDVVVGVLALAHDAGRSELFHLTIDEAQQRQGLGSAAVGLVLGHVTATRPGCRQVQLTVHPENTRAQRLYRGAGFRPTGEVRDEEPVWSVDLPVRPARRSTSSGRPPRDR